MPILKRAQAALDTLTTADIAIVRAMKKPPQGVRLIVESVCVLKVENSLFSFYSYLYTYSWPLASSSPFVLYRTTNENKKLVQPDGCDINKLV